MAAVFNASLCVRFKIAGSSHHGGRKLVSTRSNPQLGPLIPLLNQIHEESEEGANSPAADTAVDTARSSSGNWRQIQPGVVQVTSSRYSQE